VHKLFTELAERYKHRQGGYTRVLQTRQRSNDAAQMAFIECAFTRPLCSTECCHDAGLSGSLLSSPAYACTSMQCTAEASTIELQVC
jgi:Ribosomal protein L17